MKVLELRSDEFDSIAKNHELANPWQTSSFGKAAEALGYNVMYLGFEHNNSVSSAALILTKNVYLNQYVAYCPRGILTDFSDFRTLDTLLRYLKEYLNNKRIMGFTMDPPIILNIRNKTGIYKQNESSIDKKLDAILYGDNTLKKHSDAEEIRKTLLKKFNYEYRGENLYFDAILPRWYAVTTLPINPKKLLTKIDKRTRNKLRKAAKLGVDILKDDTKNIDYIYDVAKTTFGKPIEYYKSFIEDNPDCEIFIAKLNTEKYVNNSKVLYEREIDKNERINAIVQDRNRKGKNLNRALNKKMESDKIIASYKEHLLSSTETLKNYPEGKVIAFCIVTKSGDRLEIFEDGYLKEHSAISALALLRWKILEYYSDSNFRSFNFGAITGNFKKEENTLYGVNQARLSLLGSVVEYVGEFGIMTNRTLYNLYLASTKDRFHFKI